MRRERVILCCALGALAVFQGFRGPVQAQETGAKPTTAMVGRIDPSDFSTRLEVWNEYRSLKSGTDLNFLKARFDYAFSKSLMARLEVPLLHNRSPEPGVDSETGRGDILVRGGVRVAKGEGYAVIAAAEFTFDTASDERLGVGEHRCGPLVFASIEVPKLRSRFFPFYQHIFSFGGNEETPGTNYASIRPAAVLTMWPNRWYTFLDPNFYIQFEPETEYGMTLELEVGRGLNKNVSAWVRPGVGVFGDISQVYDWNLEVGFRYFFR